MEIGKKVNPLKILIPIGRISLISKDVLVMTNTTFEEIHSRRANKKPNHTLTKKKCLKYKSKVFCHMFPRRTFNSSIS